MVKNLKDEDWKRGSLFVIRSASSTRYRYFMLVIGESVSIEITVKDGTLAKVERHKTRVGIFEDEEASIITQAQSAQPIAAV